MIMNGVLRAGRPHAHIDAFVDAEPRSRLSLGRLRDAGARQRRVAPTMADFGDAAARKRATDVVAFLRGDVAQLLSHGLVKDFFADALWDRLPSSWHTPIDELAADFGALAALLQKPQSLGTSNPVSGSMPHSHSGFSVLHQGVTYFFFSVSLSNS